MFKKYMKKVLAFTLAASLAFSGAQIAGIGGADVASAAIAADVTTSAYGAAGVETNVSVTGATSSTNCTVTSVNGSTSAGDLAKWTVGTEADDVVPLTPNASLPVGTYTVVLDDSNDSVSITVKFTVVSANATNIAISDTASAKKAAYVDSGFTAYATNDFDGFLFVPSLSEIALTGATSSASQIPIEVLSKPEDWLVEGTKIMNGDETSAVTITPSKKATSADINSGTNLKIKVGTRTFKFVATNSDFSQPISGKDAINLSTAKGKVAFSDLIGADYANLEGYAAASRTWTADTALQNAASFADASDTALKNFDGAAFTGTDTIAAKAAAAGQSGNITFKNAKGEIDFANGIGLTSKKVAVAEATKTVKVNVLSESAAVNSAITIGSQGGIDLPFKAFIEASADITASEVDEKGNAVSTATGTIKIDNDKKVISVTAGATGTTHVKFVPKDSAKSGTGVQVDLRFVSGSSSKDSVLIQDTFSLPTGGVTPVELDVTPTVAGDKVDVRFESDALDAIISRGYFDSSNAKADNPFVTAGNATDYVLFTAKTGVPAGTYKAFATYYNKGIADPTTTQNFTFQELNVVVTGSAKDAPENIILNKINNADYWTYADLDKAYTKVSYSSANAVNIAKITNGHLALGTGYGYVTNAQKVSPTGNIAAGSTTNADTDWIVEGTAGASWDPVASPALCQVKDVILAAKKLTTVGIKGATLLSGVDTTVTLTSPIKEAGVVSDIALGSLQVEDEGTGARISDGFTIDGMSIKIASSALTAGKSYRVYVTTKGTNISESDTMTNNNCFNFTVQQGYKFNYNLNNGVVKTGKTLTDVAISSSQSDKVNLENGENIELVGASFLGWAYTADATKPDISAADAKAGLSPAQIKTAIDKQVNGVVELYAVWDYTTFTLTYDANGGTGTENGRNFTVAATDMILPATGFAKGDKPLVGWTTTATGKTAAGATLPVYSGTLNSAQLQAIVKEVDETAKTTAIKLYAQYGAALKAVAITPATLSLEAGKTATLTATATDEDGKTMTTPTITYTSDNTGVATVDATGVVTAVAEGTANITATATLGNVSVTSASACVVTVKAAEEPVVTKKANTLTVKAKTVTVKKGKKVTLKVAKVLTVKNAKGTVTYTKKSGNKKITIKKTTGKVTVKKGLKKGTYKVKVAVKAAGNDSYKAKTVTKTFKIKVK